MGKALRATVLVLMMLAPIFFFGVISCVPVQGIIPLPTPRQGWQTTILDGDGIVGGWPSVAVDGNGKLHVSYYDQSRGDLRYATDADGNWTILTIDRLGTVGEYSSIAVDSNDKVHISYYDPVNTDLKYATNAGGSWTNTTIDQSGVVGEYSSIAVDSNNRVHISYYDHSNGSLQYITNAGGSWVASTVDDPVSSNVGEFTSIALDDQGKVHISYMDDINNVLKYATNVDGYWAITSIIATLGVAGYNDMALDAAGNAQIAYWTTPSHVLYNATNTGGAWSAKAVTGADTVSNGVSIAYYSGKFYITYQDAVQENLHYAIGGEGWSLGVADAKVGSGYQSSLLVDSNGKMQIVNYDIISGNLRYATNAGASWHVETVDSASSVGSSNSLAIDRFNNLHIAYIDAVDHDLKYARWTPLVGWSVEVVDSSSNLTVGETSIAVDDSGKAYISYYDSNSLSLKFATNVGGSWVSQTAIGGSPLYNSLVLDGNNRAHIFFYDPLTRNIVYANNVGGNWNSKVIDSGNASGDIDALMDANGKLHVMYFTNNATSNAVIYANNIDGSWNKTTIDDVGMYSGPGVSIAMDSKGGLHAIYREASGIIYYSTNASGTWHHEMVEGPGFASSWCSIAIGPDDVVQLAYVGEVDSMIRFVTLPEGIWMRQVVNATSVGTYGQMKLDSFGRAFISFYDYTAADLDIASRITAPSAPISVHAAGSDNVVALSWASPETNGGFNVTSYRIYGGTSEADLSLVASVAGNQTSYNDLGRLNGEKRYYKIAAVNWEGAGNDSLVVNATPAAISGQPTNLHAKGISTAVELSWTAPANSGSAIVQYRIFRGLDATNLTFLANVSGSVTSYRDTGLENGKTYFYAVSAVTNVGEGALTSSVSATPVADDTTLIVAVTIAAVVIIGLAAIVLMRRRK